MVDTRFADLLISRLNETEDLLQESILSGSIKNFEELPENAKKYINAIEDFIEIPITFISVGPERNQNIVITDD